MTGSPLVTYSFFGPAHAHGGGQPSTNIGVIHDVEAPMEDGMARSLCGPNYFGHGGDAGNPVSIHYVVGPDDICQGTDEDVIAWHVGAGNSGTIGIEQLGYAWWDRAKWLADGGAQLGNLARLMADISARRPLIRLRWLSDAELVHAWHNKSSPGGWATHKQMTRVGLGSTHTDPGDNFPDDVLMSLAQGGQPAPAPAPAPQPQPQPQPQPAPQPAPAPTAEDDDMYKTVQFNGAWFAYGPGRFFHIEDPDHFAAGVAMGLFPAGDPPVVDAYHVDITRDLCLGNGSDKDMNITDELPSNVAQGK